MEKIRKLTIEMTTLFYFMLAVGVLTCQAQPLDKEVTASVNYDEIQLKNETHNELETRFDNDVPYFLPYFLKDNYVSRQIRRKRSDSMKNEASEFDAFMTKVGKNLTPEDKEDLFIYFKKHWNLKFR